MDSSFHSYNRQRLYELLPDGAVAVLFSGEAPRRSADMYYPFHCDRNFLYLTGLSREGIALLLRKTAAGSEATLYLPPKDALKERWSGKRYSADEARVISGIERIRSVDDFENDMFRLLNAGVTGDIWLNLYKNRPGEYDDINYHFARKLQTIYVWLGIRTLLPMMRRLRVIKAPCEIEAARKAEIITGEGITAMMKASRPGVFEYELKAEFEYALMKRGVIPASAPIISTGANNFFIHYDSCDGLSRDGDMILTDVGAQWDGLTVDVSRAWPVNGRFTKEQAALYGAAYDTSAHLFGIIKPGMPMRSVDETARRFCGDILIKLGLIKNADESGKLIWHGGAHHVGWDVHDVVETEVIAPGMIFCVDVGIYCEEWGIGFRLEDNCLITETGCENLSAAIPRKLEDIEAVLSK